MPTQTLNKFKMISDTIARKPAYIAIFSTISKKSGLGLFIFIVLLFSVDYPTLIRLLTRNPHLVH